MLRFSQVKKYYGDFLALDIPELSIEEGIWWVKGENGSGKTTFLKMIAALHPYRGTILLHSKLEIKKQRRKFVKLVNYAEAEPVYPSFLTIRDLVELYCESKDGDLHAAQELLKELRLFEWYNKPIMTFSTGMVKKVSIVLALIGQPCLILLDEPFVSIDTSALDIICYHINKHCKSGVSFIITSHHPVQQAKLRFTGTLEIGNRTVTKSGNE